MYNILNPDHAERHKAAACVSENDRPAIELVNPDTHRHGRVVMKESRPFIVVTDENGITVTKFKRRDNQGGFIGALSYLLRGGYE
jgi:hypothetical protein